MSLISTYTRGGINRVVDSTLVVTYSRSRIHGSWTWTAAFGVSSTTWTTAYELHRRARKSYRYVGMTEDAALACKADMIALYTRDYKESSWDGGAGNFIDGDAGRMCMAEISMNHNEDGSYDVVVNVNEDDVRTRLHAPSYIDVKTYFADESGRDYDGETEA